MKKRILGIAILFAFIVPFIASFSNCGDIKTILPTVSAREKGQEAIRNTPRELKKSPDYKTSDLYERAHHLIYGDQAPAGPGDRIKIAVVVTGDGNIVVEDRVKNNIYSQLRKKFPREDFALMKGNDVKTKLLQKEEEVYYNQRAEITEGKSVPGGYYKERTDKVDVDGMAIRTDQPRGFADLRCEDYVQAGRSCGYDYVFVFTFSNGAAEAHLHDFILFYSQTNLKQVWMRVRMVDVAKGNYVYRNDMTAKGKTHNDNFNGRIIEKAVDSMMREAMDDIDI